MPKRPFDRSTLVTGFLAFEGFPVNPSALLAAQCGRSHMLIEVSYRAVDEFVESVDPNAFDRLILVGVAGKGSHLRIERFAQNAVGARPDVRGTVLGPAPIEPGLPDRLPGTIWSFTAIFHDCRWSDDAGDYLCNYLYWRALRRFPQKRVGFVHVPPLTAIDLTGQLQLLHSILRGVESTR